LLPRFQAAESPPRTSLSCGLKINRFCFPPISGFRIPRRARSPEAVSRISGFAEGAITSFGYTFSWGFCLWGAFRQPALFIFTVFFYIPSCSAPRLAFSAAGISVAARTPVALFSGLFSLWTCGARAVCLVKKYFYLSQTAISAFGRRQF